MQTSLIPPKERLIKEYWTHANMYEHLNSNAYLNDWISEADSQEMNWHGDEMEKLGKVLDALYPNWDKKVNNKSKSTT